MKSAFFDGSSRPVNQLTQDSYKIIRSCANKGWFMTEFQYTFMTKISEQVLAKGTDEEKKQYCRLLHEAQTRALLTDHAGCYITLVGNFRKSCAPLLTDETSYSDIEMDFTELNKITTDLRAFAPAAHSTFAP